MSSKPSARQLNAFIFDLDGVIWRGNTPIPGATSSVEALRAAGKRIFFATNNSSRPPAFFAERLRVQGIDARPEDVITSSSATELFLKRAVKRGTLPAGFSAYIVGEVGVADAVTGAGGLLVAGDALRADIVIAGIDREFTYEKLRHAQRFVLAGAQFIATNRDATFPVEGGVVPGAGSVVAAVATACGLEPPSMGKPEPLMVQLILEAYGQLTEHTAMVGDRLDTDIACGHRAGVVAVHIGTGVDSTATARAARGEELPHLFYADLPALLQDVTGQ